MIHEGISFPPPPSSSSSSIVVGFTQENSYLNPPNPNPNPNREGDNASGNKRKRSQPGNPDPDAEVVALSPVSLMATNRFICEVCNKGFQREQNLQLHRRGHNLPWKLKQKSNKEVVKKKVYICPIKSCVHHDPSRALGDLTGIKKHYSRKHGEKKWKCDKCSKKYAVMSDWKAHSKICGTREYKCDCGTIFSRKDSFITHRAFCDALTEERMRVATNVSPATMNTNFRSDLINGSLISTPQSVTGMSPFLASHRPDFAGFDHPSSSNPNNTGDGFNKPRLPLWLDQQHNHIDLPSHTNQAQCSFLSSMPQDSIPKDESDATKSTYPQSLVSLYSSQAPPSSTSPASMSATALLQKAAQMGSTRSENASTIFATAFGAMRTPPPSPAPANHHSNLADMYRHQMSRQLAAERGYLAADQQLMMMGEALSNDAGNKMSTNAGMRDFLGTLEGASGSNNGGNEGQRSVLMQDDMAYKLATMAGSGHHDHHQETYMDLMR